MRRDAWTLVIADGVGVLLAAVGLALARDPHVVATARATVPHLPWPVLIPTTAGLLLAAAYRKRRSRTAVGASLVFAEERRAWQRAVLEGRGFTTEPHPRSSIVRPVGMVVVGAAVGAGLGAPALGVTAGLLLGLVLAPPGARP